MNAQAAIEHSERELESKKKILIEMKEEPTNWGIYTPDDLERVIKIAERDIEAQKIVLESAILLHETIIGSQYSYKSREGVMIALNYPEDGDTFWNLRKEEAEKIGIEVDAE